MTEICIDPKYCTRSLSVLTDDEALREAKMPRSKFMVELFTDDLDLAQKNNLNISRIIRFKFHDWLQSKIIKTEE